MRLPFAHDDKWRWRWMQAPKSGTLHRVASFDKEDWEYGAGVVKAKTVCGQEHFRLLMPGIFSRTGANRCEACCDLLGIERGFGAPYNKKIKEPTSFDPKKAPSLKPPTKVSHSEKKARVKRRKALKKAKNCPHGIRIGFDETGIGIACNCCLNGLRYPNDDELAEDGRVPRVAGRCFTCYEPRKA